MEKRSQVQPKTAPPTLFIRGNGGLQHDTCCRDRTAGVSTERRESRTGNQPLSLQYANQGLGLVTRNFKGVSTDGPDVLRSTSKPIDATTRSSTDPRYGHNFGDVRIHAGADSTTSEPNDQSPVQSGGLDEKFMQGGTPEPAPGAEPKQDINLGKDETKAPAMPLIDSVEMVTSSSGAIGGFPEISCLASLNSPGPYNDQAFRGSVANVHQVHFHLSQGYPGDLRATRMINRTSVRAGQNYDKSGNDGPPDHEYLYTKDKMVIADAPGWCKTLQDQDFPVNYKADFSMYAWDAPTKSILASISYHVEIEKTHYSQPGPVNTVTVTAQKIGGAVKSPVVPKT